MSVQAEQPISFEGTQPLLAAAIAPCFAATTPVFSISMRDMEVTGKGWLIAGYCAVILTLVFISFWAAFRRHHIHINLSSIQINNKTYPMEEIKKLELRTKSRYVNVFLNQRWGSLTYHVKDREEFQRLCESIQSWGNDSQVEISVLEK